jgi:hypothetical protein
MHVVPTDLRPGVFLKTTQFALVARILGHTSDAALGRAIGMSDKTIGRAREGVIGEQFIAAVLTAFGEHEELLKQYGISVKFEDLFEIGNKQAAA